MEPSPSRRQVAFLVNPIAGMGGAVALKGTDGEALKEALARGATPRAPARASDFVRAAAALSLSIRWLTCAGPMGENVLASAKTPHEVVSKPHGAVTTPADTAAACRVFLDRKVDLIAFVGGDGTAKDIFAVVGDRVPLLGIPSGVKMHSGVFAITPRAAAELLQAFLDGRTRIEEGEIVDEDEAAMSRGVIEVNLAGAAKTLVFEGLTQAAKVEYGGEIEEVSKRGIADTILERMDENTLYIVGPGTTAGAVMEAMGLKHTLLGVDLVRGRKLVRADATDAQLREALAAHGGPCEIIVGVIGAQGFVFGRGNLQLSPAVIRAVGKQHITVVAAEKKVEALEELFVDTGEPSLDAELAGHWRVLCGYRWNVFLPMRARAAPK